MSFTICSQPMYFILRFVKQNCQILSLKVGKTELCQHFSCTYKPVFSAAVKHTQIILHDLLLWLHKLNSKEVKKIININTKVIYECRHLAKIIRIILCDLGIK